MGHWNRRGLCALIVGLCALSPAAARAAGPLSLTASDGTGLKLVSLRARAVIQGPLAFTQLHLTFQNPQNRTLEGRFQITLPQGAAISRFAMRIGTDWQEAEVVERQEARDVYETFLHRRVDPALLEKKAGNSFRARIFPIPPRARKEILISYSQELRGAREPYRLLLRGLPRIQSFELSAAIMNRRGARRVLRTSRTNYRPKADLKVPTDRSVAGLIHGRIALLRVRPGLAVRRVRVPGLLVLLDTSASRALGLKAQLGRLSELLGELRHRHGDRFPLKVVCFDQRVFPAYEGPANLFGAAHVRRILARGALGASDLGAALRYVAGVRGYRRLLLMTDGVVTAGEARASRLARLVSRLKHHVSRLDVVAIGGIRDDALLRRLVTGTLAQEGAVHSGELPLHRLAQRLSRVVRSGIKVSIPGARWVWPRQLDVLQPGDERLVYADLGPGTKTAPVTVRLSGPIRQTRRIRLVRVERPLLERAWVGARIARLRAQGQSAAIRKRIVDLSIKHRVLTEHTALLVLETDGDYRRFGLERRGLADILVVRNHAVQVHARSRRVLGSGRSVAARKAAPRRRSRRNWRKARWSRPSPPRRASRSRRRQAPRVFMSRATVSGGLDAASIRRVIRRHLAEVKHCYEQGLQLRPTLSGLVKVAFLIDQSGRVAVSTVASSTLGSRPVESCIARAVFRWRFPAVPEDGLKYVTYPFRFKPKGGGSTVPSRRRRVAVDPRRHPTTFRRAIRRPLPPRSVRTPRWRPLPNWWTSWRARDSWKAPPPTTGSPYAGRFKRVVRLLQLRKRRQALALARRWRRSDPGGLLPLLALGRALKALGNHPQAARAYGSIIDLFPSRAERRRLAGEQLLALGPTGLALALDTLRKALRQRPDHPTGYRLLGYALLRQGRPAAAFRVVARALRQRYPQQRLNGFGRILRKDLGLIARVWLRRAPWQRRRIRRLLRRYRARLATRPSLRAVLSWESDANDLDLHVLDAKGDRSYHGRRALKSGGMLYGDVTNGFGPEMFLVQGRPEAYPYRLQVHYYNRDVQGVSAGTVQIVRHDGRGRLQFSDRPFVAMTSKGLVDLGLVKDPHPPNPKKKSVLPGHLAAVFGEGEKSPVR